MASTKILLTGKHGQLGFELQRSLAVLGDVVAVGREDCDLRDLAAVRTLVRTVCPDIIVNPAAYTAVDQAESNSEAATQLNALAPQVLAEEATKLNALMIHYSTDYVFDGKKNGAYLEQDEANPLSIYGQSKYAGELAVAAANPRHLIFRTSWMLGAYGDNFLKTMLRLMITHDELKIVSNQFGSPTAASLIADITAQITAQYLQSERQVSFPFGTFHLSATGETSWHQYALFIMQIANRMDWKLRLTENKIQAINAEFYPAPALRPLNSRLCLRKLQDTFNLTLPHWQNGVEQVMTLLKQGIENGKS